MSRSLRKNKIIGHCGGVNRSERRDKRRAHKKLRVRLHNTLKAVVNQAGTDANSKDTEIDVYLTLRHVSDIRTFSKEGKFYWVNMPARFLRK